MIVILQEAGLDKTSDLIEKILYEAFKNHVEIVLMNAAAPAPWPRDFSWDDLLITLYSDSIFPDAGNDFINEYRTARSDKGLLLPVALDPAHRKPPKAAETIKAFEFDESDAHSGERLIHRVGAMLGLRVQQRDTKVFISYRATDGTATAIQLELHLITLGYPTWRDEAKELDGETKILPGSEVQQQIDAGLREASIVLLLDTPNAPHSPWVKHEVDTANAQLLPILPLCFRPIDDEKKGPRFRSLFDLQRWVDVPLLEPLQDPPLTDDVLQRIILELERYLCEIFQRKCRVPFIVEKEFVQRNYTWKMLDRRLLMCESVKTHSLRTSTKVFSHCSIFDQVRGPTLKAFSKFLKKTGRPNHALYIYDGELIPEPELIEIIEAIPADDGVVILHHQELAALIESEFRTFSP